MDVAKNAWKSTYNQLELQWDRANFETWLSPTEFLSVEADTFIIGVPNSYICDMLQYRLYDDVKSVLCEVMQTDVEIEFRVHRRQPTIEEVNQDMPLFRLMSRVEDEDKDDSNRRSLHEVVGSPKRDELPESILNPRFTFDRFVISPSNQMAVQAAMSIAEYPATTYNPFLVYGGVGIGKTHLLQAIANACIQQGHRVLYIPSEAFTNDLVNAIRNRTTAMFREKYRSVDVLLVDDIQFIRGKDTTQEEFFHTFNALVNHNKQIVLASDRHPSELETLEDRLRSRFAGGLAADIGQPEIETCIAIMDMWACERSVDVPRHTLELIAERASGSIRELQGMFNRIVAQSRMNGFQNMTLNRVEDSLNRYEKPREQVTVARIIDVVAEAFNMTGDILRGKKRAARINHARQVAMYLAREMTESSLPQIGEFFGRSHTTVLHGCNKVEEEMEADPVLLSRIQRLRNQISRL